MSKSILNFSRDEVKEYAKIGVFRINSLFHFDVCQALAMGKKVDEVSEDFRLSDRQVFRIKQVKCPECKK